jgi:hypothetical protein
MRRRWWAYLVLAAIAGCRSFAVVPHAPEGNTIVRDQLVIHSDFPLRAEERLLDELAAQRERLWERIGLARTNRPIDVYLFQAAHAFEQFAAGAYPEFPRRRAFFVEADGKLAVYAHWNDRVAEDLRHEVCHGYLHAAIDEMPLWLVDGLAEFFETSPAADGLNAEHVIELAAAIERENWRPNLARLESLPPTEEFAHRDYAESWAWVHFLLDPHEQRGQLLQGYVADLARLESPEPLSNRIRRVHYQPEETLREHVLELRRGLDGRQAKKL